MLQRLAFNRNVQDGTQRITATRAELGGLPDDFIARQQLARLLGFSNYADLATAELMTGSGAAVRKLIDDVDVASRGVAQKEAAQLLAFVQTREPGIAAISDADAFYWPQQYRRRRYTFDAQSVRPYFPYDRVEAGVLGAAAQIFHVRFEAVRDAQVWHPSVTVYDVIDGGLPEGRDRSRPHQAGGPAGTGFPRASAKHEGVHGVAERGIRPGNGQARQALAAGYWSRLASAQHWAQV